LHNNIADVSAVKYIFSESEIELINREKRYQKDVFVAILNDFGYENIYAKCTPLGIDAETYSKIKKDYNSGILSEKLLIKYIKQFNPSEEQIIKDNILPFIRKAILEEKDYFYVEAYCKTIGLTEDDYCRIVEEYVKLNFDDEKNVSSYLDEQLVPQKFSLEYFNLYS
jgi:hypothetical protein